MTMDNPNSDSLRHSAAMAKQKYPGRLPIYVQKSERCKTLPDIRKHKFLVPSDLTLGQFCVVLRRHIHVTDKQALFLTAKGTIPPMNALIPDLYEKFKSEDEFLHIEYVGENTFG